MNLFVAVTSGHGERQGANDTATATVRSRTDPTLSQQLQLITRDPSVMSVFKVIQGH